MSCLGFASSCYVLSAERNAQTFIFYKIIALQLFSVARSGNIDAIIFIYSHILMTMKSRLLCAPSLSRQCIRQIFLNKPTSYRHIADSFTHTVENAGYRSESHKLKTEDGYILKLHRVLPKKHSSHKGSAFLMHGLFRDSSDFLATGPKTALGYYLADHGYDGKIYLNFILKLSKSSKIIFSVDWQRERNKTFERARKFLAQF